MRDGVDERGERLDEARDDLLEVGVRGAAEHEPRAELRPVGGVLLLLVDLEVRQQSLGELRHRFSPKTKHLHRQHQLLQPARARPEQAAPRGLRGQLRRGALLVHAAIERREHAALRQRDGPSLPFALRGERFSPLRLPGLRGALEAGVRRAPGELLALHEAAPRRQPHAQRREVDVQHAAGQLVPRAQRALRQPEAPRVVAEVRRVHAARQPVVQPHQHAALRLHPRHRRAHLRPAVERRPRLAGRLEEQRLRVQGAQRRPAVRPAGPQLVLHQPQREVQNRGDLR